MLLPLHKLMLFNEEFAAFFSELARVEPIHSSNCNYDLSIGRETARLEDPQKEGWLFLRDRGHTYLLIETAEQGTGWNSWFAPDPKRVLTHLRQELSPEPRFSEWKSLFPLVRQAHREAHGDREDSRNRAYLQELITKLYHAASLPEALGRYITQLDSQSHSEQLLK